MRTVIIMGKGELACKVLDWYNNSGTYSVIGVVPVIPEPTWTKSLSNHAKKWGNSVLKWDYKKHDFKEVEIGGANLLVSIFWDSILEKDFIDRFQKTINLHNAPLPSYRGVAPVNWALENKEEYHGVTIHEIAPGVDDGPIYGQIRFPISQQDEVKDVYERCLDFGWQLFKATAPIIFTTEPFSQKANKETKMSYYSSVKKGDLKTRFDWVQK